MYYQSLLESVFEFPFQTEELFSIQPTEPDNKISEFAIYLTQDMDIHIAPSLNFSGNNEDYFENLFFSYYTNPIFTNLLKILAYAIEMDNKFPIYRGFEREKVYIVSDYIDKIIKANDFPDVSGDYQIVHDDNDGQKTETLQISFCENGVNLRVNAMDGLRFRTYFGGGRHHRTRNALAIICYFLKNKI